MLKDKEGGYTYSALIKPKVVVLHCEDCTGVLDCDCSMAGSQHRLTDEEFDALVNPKSKDIENPPMATDFQDVVIVNQNV